MFFFFCFLTNIIVTSMLILGGASVMNALTGMDIYAVRALARAPLGARTLAWCSRAAVAAVSCMRLRHACMRPLAPST